MERLKMMLYSCSNWGFGYFNAYDIGSRYNLDFWVHLGDYVSMFRPYLPPSLAPTLPVQWKFSSCINCKPYRTSHYEMAHATSWTSGCIWETTSACSAQSPAPPCGIVTFASSLDTWDHHVTRRLCNLALPEVMPNSAFQGSFRNPHDCLPIQKQ